MLCKAKELCNPVVGRDLSSRDVCSSCCDSDGCNQYACAPVSTTVQTTVAGQITCDTSAGYQLFTNTAGSAQLCAKIHTERKSWDEARTMCQSEGGDLVVLDSAAKSLLMKHQVYQHRHTGYWIGGKDLLGQDTFQWVNNQDIALDIGDWANGQPNNFDGGHAQDCVNMWGQDDYEWHDDMCARPLEFICERS
ncbi:perlucin-like protein [Mya arenaria]|uniref:perlucin-like protein n=1 Tax=Mya arenaria TaxID=6604 RepID=UPI0022E87CC9|nr:perlucin-like protein [Mya arenaria]